MEFTLNIADAPFDLACTLESGQVFRWENRDGWWYGILDQGVVRVRQEQSSLICVSSSDRLGPRYLHQYFGLDDDLPSILSSINKDSAMMEAAQRFYGLRLIRQTVWECIISFTIATNINMPRIAKTIAALSERFGEQVEFEGSQYSLFPRPENLALADVEALAACGLGYRTKFVKHVAQAVYEERVDFSELQMQIYGRARELLIGKVLGKKSLLGIGPKVADCVLLFSCGKYDAFPIDVWIARGLARYYPLLFDRGLKERLELKSKRKGTLSQKEYDLASGAAREHFGKYAGYAQQYLYVLARTNSNFINRGQE